MSTGSETMNEGDEDCKTLFVQQPPAARSRSGARRQASDDKKKASGLVRMSLWVKPDVARLLATSAETNGSREAAVALALESLVLEQGRPVGGSGSARVGVLLSSGVVDLIDRAGAAAGFTRKATLAALLRPVVQQLHAGVALLKAKA